MSASAIVETRAWTLRLKYRKLTVCIFAEGGQSLHTLQNTLFEILKDTCKDGKIEGSTLPVSAEGIEFAKPKNTTDLHAGWEPLQPSESVDESLEAAEKSNPSKKRRVDTSLEAFGIGPDYVLAFRFKDEAIKMDEAAADQWDVSIPEFNDHVDEEHAQNGQDNDEDAGGDMAEDEIPVPSSRFAT